MTDDNDAYSEWLTQVVTEAKDQATDPELIALADEVLGFIQGFKVSIKQMMQHQNELRDLVVMPTMTEEGLNEEQAKAEVILQDYYNAARRVALLRAKVKDTLRRHRAFGKAHGYTL